jgi:putative SOS response-associated peptidase YedK
MCGRFTLTVDPAQIQQAFPWLEVPPQVTPSFNIAPSQPVAVVANSSPTRLDYFKWGLVPSWAKDPAIGSRMINARAETLAEKPSFRTAFRRRRCLVLADGFYEWRKDPGGKSKTPMYIKMKTGQPFAFAGLWEAWNSPDGSLLLTCAIITTAPNSLMAAIHDRMPVILSEQAFPLWLDGGEHSPAELQPLLQPYPEAEMQAFPVSRLVNSPQNDLPDCILPLAD